MKQRNVLWGCCYAAPIFGIRTLRTAFAHKLFATIGLAVFLSACGGGSGSSSGDAALEDDSGDDSVSFSIGGIISGGTGDITLALNGESETFFGAAFSFDAELSEGESYSVTFVSASDNLSCSISNGSGNADGNISDISVVCNEVSQDALVLSYPDAEISREVQSGDFNGDGYADLVFPIFTTQDFALGANPLLRVVFGDGAGGIADSHDVFQLGGATMTSGNYNNDDIDDFAYTSAAPQVFAGRADNEPSLIYTGTDPFGFAPRTGDVDGDGFEDLMSIILGGSQPALFALIRNNGDGTFADQEFIANRFSNEANTLCLGSPLNFELADFNGDTVLDILALSTACDPTGVDDDEHNALAFFEGNGDGSFEYPVAIDVLPDEIFLGQQAFDNSFKDMAIGDFDMDGDLDVALTSTTNFLLIMLNDGSGRFSENQRVSVGQSSFSIDASDFDNDGFIDIASANRDSKSLVISLGNGDGTFTELADSIVIDLDSDFFVEDMALADMNGDGFMDVILAESGTNGVLGSVQVFFSPGA